MNFNNIRTLKLRWKIAISVMVLLLILNAYYLFKSPTNNGPWLEHYQQLAEVELNANLVTIKNFRRARYDESGNISVLNYSDKTVDLNQLDAVWYGISQFASPGLAHTFLSFDFGDQDPVVVSVEARMQPGQSYGPIEGALDNYHLIYVFADERDIVGVRTHKRNEAVRFMPTTADKSRMIQMFKDMAERANSLIKTPEFYNTFTSNCTNNIMQQTAVSAWQYYLDPRIILPAYSDSIAYDFGVLDQNYTLEQHRAAALLDASTFSDTDQDFYHAIRQSYYDGLQLDWDGM